MSWRSGNSWLAAVAVVLLSGQASLAQDRDYVPGEVLVKLKKQPGSGASGQAQSLKSFMGKVGARRGLSLKRSWAGLNMHKFKVSDSEGGDTSNKNGAGSSKNVESLINELQNDPDVEYAEPNYYIRKQEVGDEIQNVMSYQEFQAQSTVREFAMTGASIDAQDAWGIASATTSDDVVVAIIDTGIDKNHTVFVQTGAIWTNPGEVAGNGIDDDGNGYVDDTYGWNFVANSNAPIDDDGHGTHVAGIILGTTQDIRATTLSAAKIKIMPLKFLDGDGVGTTSDAIEAIYYASNNGARVLNNSWGGGGFSNSLLDAILYAYNKKTVFVAAAGNSASNNDASPTYPANYAMPNLISVAASNDYDILATFSNYGAYTVHLGSPGVSILSTVPGNGFAYSSGTSMAAPFVSGVAALMAREQPNMNGYQIKQLLLSGGEAVSSLSGKTTTSKRLNVYNSVDNVQKASVDSYMPAYDPSSNQRATASASMQQAGCGLVAKNIFDKSGSGGSNPPRNMMFFGLMLVLLAPVVVSLVLRQTSGKNKRVHTRYQIDSQVRVRFGDRELVGSVSSISLGGVQLNTDAWLEHGGVVKMQIASPDGKDLINVEGKVVWCEEQKRYGVAFQNAGDGVLSAISRWTQSLMRT